MNNIKPFCGFSRALKIRFCICRTISIYNNTFSRKKVNTTTTEFSHFYNQTMCLHFYSADQTPFSCIGIKLHTQFKHNHLQ